ncbi:unannotated protein [freshwater metagenome]|uniref:Unannotated protein n=1 Tax=freshwater metagenome TaxID=449393 RepID=A0A6J7C5Q9_9ZZZZ
MERGARLAGLEEDVGVLRAATQHRPIRIEAALAMRPDERFVDQLAQLLGRRQHDGVQFVAGAEPVEEVEERHTGGQSGRVRDCRHVGGFGDVVRTQHREPGAPRSHHVAVVAEDAEGMRGHRASGDVNHRGGQFAGDLEHLRQHQQQALAGGERGGQRPTKHGTVQRGRSASLTLHLDHLGDDAPQVRVALRAPFIGMLAHWRSGSDRVDRNHLGEQMRNSRDRLIGIDYLTSQLGCGRLVVHECTLRTIQCEGPGSFDPAEHTSGPRSLAATPNRRHDSPGRGQLHARGPLLEPDRHDHVDGRG